MYLKMHFDCHPTVVPFEAGDVYVGYVEGLVLPLQEMKLAERFLDVPNMEKKVSIIKRGIYKPEMMGGDWRGCRSKKDTVQRDGSG
jgi:hypothetical protein